jgi:luciferase family oxidoreductase group 1
MSEQMSLGVLDFCSVPPKRNSKYALHKTIELACQVEALGYSRYWLAEHHGSAAHASPEILIPLIAALTKRIRIGAAGILLYFYSSLKVAENFKLLETLFSGRIDLGVCGGYADPLTAQALLDGRTKEPDLDLYKEKVEHLINYLCGSSEIPVTPVGSVSPEVWILGSGTNSLPLAAQNGVAYSHSLLHIGFQDNPSILQEYRELFQSKAGKISTTQCNIAVAGICADTEAQARQLLKQHNNKFIVPSIVGNPSQCKKKLLALQKRYGVDEIIFLDLCQKFEDRLRSYELLAAELQLTNSTENVKIKEFSAVA